MNKYKALKTIEEVDVFIKDHPLSMIYLSRVSCSVCHDLFPKIETLLKDFPKIRLGLVVADEVEEVASKFTIFSVPTIIFFVDGKEYFRESRFISVQLLKEKLEKIYELYFSD